MTRQLEAEFMKIQDKLDETERNRQENIQERVMRVRDHLDKVEQKQHSVKANREHGEDLEKSFKLVQKLVVGTNSSLKTKNMLI
jgi:cell fate (sporulation/competence/biofilm development) regulator YlbF (YheA/YmcA/DUF963 family)